jgi:formylglycine-generating enzyme required for sulfatase activity
MGFIKSILALGVSRLQLISLPVRHAICVCGVAGAIVAPLLVVSLESNEEPVDVRITREMWVGSTEVTQGQWRQIMGHMPWMSYVEKRLNDNNAATHMTWDEAVDFCQRLTDRERRAGNIPVDGEFRLPTEADWEYFCRAGTFNAFCYGDDEAQIGDYAWWKGNTQDVNEGYAHEVGTLKPNAWGLHDIHGNGFEFCYDSYSPHLPGGDDLVVTDPPIARKVTGYRCRYSNVQIRRMESSKNYVLRISALRVYPGILG